MSNPQELLRQRLAALRAPIPPKVNNNNNNKSEVPPPSSSVPPDSTRFPSPSLPSPPGPSPPAIETKHISDDDVEAYLSSFSPPSTLPAPPPPTTDRALNAALSSYERLAPAFVSPIEVSFASPGVSRTEDEDEALIHRLRDELSIENAHAQDDEDGVAGWGRRLEGLKGVVVGGSVEPGGMGPGEAPDPVGVEDFRDESDESGSEEESDKSVDSDDGD
ncbi:hypothetical protein RQP46_007127 [Phenoliferia psychrophenolica]